MTNLDFRKAEPKDAPLLAATRQKVWAATYRGIYPDEMIDQFDYEWHIRREERNLNKTTVHTYLVMDGENCVGYFTYFIQDTPLWRDFHVRLFSLYLLPEYQGCGMGKKIFQQVACACRQAGYDKLYLSCAPQNRKAMGFYHHLGGRIVAQDIGHENPAEDTAEFEFYI